MGAEPRRGLGRDGGPDLGVRPSRRHRATDRDRRDPAGGLRPGGRHGDEHVVKLADAVLDAHAATGNDRLLTAAGYAGQLI